MFALKEGRAALAPALPCRLVCIGRRIEQCARQEIGIERVLFGGQVQLYVSGEDDAARSLAEQLPSASSRDFGKPFAKVFKDYGYDFYKVDPMLFSPARAVVTNVSTGRSFVGGELHPALLDQSFGG